MTASLAPSEPADYLRDWKAAREARELARREPYGYLSYVGLHRLTATPTAFDGVPGRWSTGPDGPEVYLGNEHLVIDDVVVTGTHGFAPLRERERRRAAQSGELVLELSQRGGVDLLRPIDPDFGRTRQDAYDHTPAYEPDERWVLAARFEPFDALRPTRLGATVGDLTHVHPVVGEIVVRLEDAEHRLLVIAPDTYEAGNAGTGNIVFRDATNGITTDPLGRAVQVAFPAGPGAVTLDLNRAQNLQRPYTAFAPCPLSPEQNELPVAVEAGDRLPVFRG